VVVKVRLSTFFTRTHGRTLPEPTRAEPAIEAAALSALDAFERRGRVRLVGVRCEFA
jgi:DNA polymerase-4